MNAKSLRVAAAMVLPAAAPAKAAIDDEKSVFVSMEERIRDELLRQSEKFEAWYIHSAVEGDHQGVKYGGFIDIEALARALLSQ